MYTLVPSALYHSARNRLIYSASYIPLLVFGIAGCWQLRRRWKELSLLWAWLITTTTSLLPLFVLDPISGRHGRSYPDAGGWSVYGCAGRTIHPPTTPPRGDAIDVTKDPKSNPRPLPLDWKNVTARRVEVCLALGRFPVKANMSWYAAEMADALHPPCPEHRR